MASERASERMSERARKRERERQVHIIGRERILFVKGKSLSTKFQVEAY